MAGNLGFNVGSCDSHFCPTLLPASNFNPEDDCERLRTAMAGLGTNEKELIEVLGHRSADQRAIIAQKYKSLFGKDLITKLKSEISGHFYDTMEALCCSPAEFDARELHRAMKGAGTDESVLIEILCTRTNHQIRQIKEAYGRLFSGHDLEGDIIGDTSGDFKHLCIALLQAGRDESTQVDAQRVRKDAEALYEAGEKKWGTDESKFIQVFASRSHAHLRALCQEYNNVGKKTLEDALKSEMHGHTLQSFLTLVQCANNKALYFAEKLKQSMKGAGTNDRMLIRIIVSRCEIDLGLIKKEFYKLTGDSLESWIEGDTSGDYRRLLLALVHA
uniref:Annexin n=1 Tax=Schistosoma japonicum TaxID=6182 RepID=C1L4R5_SCHJA|nr:Annexin A4 (Annexin IV) X) (35-beta calcimedin) (Carbohydrate-binding protein P33/P41) (P33/41) [Schistosoma japonicum]